MRNLKVFLDAVETLPLKTSGDKINQIQRNALKNDALNALMADLNEVEVIRTLDGLVLVIPNDELGAVCLELDLKVKNLDFDVELAGAEYETALADRAERVKLAAEKKAKALAKKAKE